jgi:hypothetical protein
VTVAGRRKQQVRRSGPDFCANRSKTARSTRLARNESSGRKRLGQCKSGVMRASGRLILMVAAASACRRSANYANEASSGENSGDFDARSRAETLSSREVDGCGSGDWRQGTQKHVLSSCDTINFVDPTSCLRVASSRA